MTGPAEQTVVVDTPRTTRGHGRLEGFLARQRYHRADTLIDPSLRNGRLLDLGCGSYPSFLMATDFTGKHGLDQLPHPARLTDSEGRDIILTDGDLLTMDTLPYSDADFDVITMLAVIEHLAADRAANLLTELHRLLRPGGQLIITTPASWTGGLLTVLAAVGLVSKEEIDEHQSVWPPARMTADLTAAGFPSDRIRHGYFEAFMNSWFVAQKCPEI